MSNGALLAKISLIAGSVPFEDTESVEWVDTSSVKWGGVEYAADETISDTHKWVNYIMGLAPIQLAIATTYGGYIRSRYGDISLSPKFFYDRNIWPPSTTLGISLFYTASDEASKVLLLEGLLHLAEIKADEIVYDVYSGTLDESLLLETVEDYNGKIVPVPKALGTVSYATPIRYPDVSGDETYGDGGLPTYIVWDGGIDVTSITTDNGDDTFSFTGGSPVDSVTISGTATETTLEDIFTWGVSRLSLSLNTDDARGTSPDVSRWIADQRKTVEFLSDIAAPNTHFFNVKNSILYLVDMDGSVDSRTMKGHEVFFPGIVKLNPPVAMLESKWQERESGEFRTAGGAVAAQYVRSIDKSTSQSSGYVYGREIMIDPYSEDIDDIDDMLSNILEYLHSTQVSFSIPFTDDLPEFGESVTITDPNQIIDMTSVLKVRSMKINPLKQNPYVELTGDAVISDGS